MSSEIDGETKEERMRQIQEWHMKCLKKHGWYAHFVPDESFPLGMNIHTHGLLEGDLHLHHLDLQIVLPLQPEVAQGVLHAVTAKIKGGKVFQDGEKYDGILKAGFLVAFAKALEGERIVLRIILPDPDGKIDKAEMDPDYARQYDGLFKGIDGEPLSSN